MNTMDGPLSSSRHGDGDGGNYNHQRGGDNRYSGGGGGGGNSDRYHNRGRHNRHNNNYNNRPYHHHHRGNRGRGGRYNNYRGRGGGGRHHYGRGGGGGGGNRSAGNRFPTSNAASIDPEKAMLKQLSAMVATMGDWSSASSSAGVHFAEAAPSFIMDDNEEQKQQMLDMQIEDQTNNRKTVLQTIAKNVTDLSSVLTNPQTAPQFLKFTPLPNNESADANMDGEAAITTTTTPPSIDEEKQAGPLATLLVACAYALPLQTASYASLTIAVEKGLRSNESSDYKGFAQRCLQMASTRLHIDLKCMLTNTSTMDSSNINNNNASDMTDAGNMSSPAECFRRCKFILRYLAVLVKAGLLCAHNIDLDLNDVSSLSSSKTNMGLMDLLQYLTLKQREFGTGSQGPMLAHLILSTLPYLSDVAEDVVSKSDLQSLLETVSNTLAEFYRSPYKPGEGVLSILLKEEPSDGDEEEEDSDDDEDDEEEEDAEPCCDSLQELLRTNHSLLNNPNDALFGALTDAPWVNTDSISDDAAVGETDMDADASIQSLYIPFVPLPAMDETNYGTNPRLLSFPHHPLSSIILGRLPIYASPPTDDDDDDDDDDEEENSANKPQTPFVTNFTLSARTFLNDAIRDILHCHHPTISTSGLERGSCKSVAQQIWSLHILFAPHSIHGMEFGIVECILGLIAQSHQLNNTKSAANLTRIYISRVLLELTNLYPTKVPQALAISVATMVENILPSLVPQSAHVLADWFAFHLINTDFQWPKEYWNYWAQEDCLKGCKKEFFTRVLEVMTSLAGKKVIIEDCLPPNSPLVNLLGPSEASSLENNTSYDLEKELRDRMWLEMELSNTLDDWMTEYDDSFEDAKSRDGEFWRAKLVTRALLSPPGLRLAEEKDEDHTNDDDDEDMGDDEEGHKEKDDPLQDLLAGFKRYAPLVASSITKGLASAGLEEDEANKDTAEAAVLMQIQETLEKNSSVTLSMIEAVHEAVLEHKIVSSLGFLKLFLSKPSPSSTIASGWFLKSGLCTKYTVTSEITLISEGVGMVLDSDDKTLRITNVVKQVTHSLSPVMEYACRRVCTLLLSSMPSNPIPEKKLKLTREMVILVEGLKQTLWEGQMHCCKLLRKYFEDGPGRIILGQAELDDDVRRAIKELLENSIGGKKLMIASKEIMEDFNGGMDITPDSIAGHVKQLMFPWMEKLVVE